MSNQLQLNPAKTEVLLCSSARRQHQIPTGPVRDTSVLPVRTVRDFGVYSYADVTMMLTSLQSSKGVLLHSVSVRCSLTCTCGHKGELLQLSSLRHFRTTVTMAAVCLRRRRSSRVLDEEVGAHNSKPP